MESSLYNGLLVLHDAVIEQHRSLTEDIHRALVELLTKRFLDGDHLAERCNAMARSRRPASGSEATEARIVSVLTR